MSHSNHGKRRWKENRRRHKREEARRDRIDERLARPEFRERHHRQYARYLMCTRKHAYPTAEEAIRACLHASANTGQMFRPYECPICHNWHITSRVRTKV